MTDCEHTDYEHPLIARSYGQARMLPAEAMATWVAKIKKAADLNIEAQLVLDLGCGVGRFLDPLAEAFPYARVVGVEPAMAMIREVRVCAGPRISLVRARAPALPFSDRSFDVIFISMVLHYFIDPIQGLRDCYRILRPGGAILVRSGTKESIPSFRFLADFPEAMQIELERMPTRRRLVETVRSAGLSGVRLESVPQISVKSYSEYYERVRLRGFPSLALISDDDFRKGLARFAQTCQHQSPHAVPPEEIVDLVVGRKPG